MDTPSRRSLTLALASVLVAAVTHAQPVAPGDHYLCYQTKPARAPSGTPDFPVFEPRSGDVVIDRFSAALPQGAHTLDLKKSVALCNPARKNGEPVQEPTGHLLAYPTKLTRTDPKQSKRLPSNHLVVNQFGTYALTVRTPDRLLVPSAKAEGTGGVAPLPAGTIDHFMCYRVKALRGAVPGVPFPPALPTGVVVEDQFGTTLVDLRAPTRFCAPANKNGEDAGAPAHAGHLLCYKAKRTRTRPEPQPKFQPRLVSTANQFGAEVLNARRIEELCVPSLRDPAAPTPTVATPTPVQSPSTLVALRVSPLLATLDHDGNEHFTATAEFQNTTTKNYTQKVTWVSSDETVASVSNAEGSRGLVTALLPGTTTIKAVDPVTNVSSDDSAASAQVTVLGQLESITLAPDTASRAVGSTVNVTATGHYTGGGTKNLTQRIDYTSSEPSIAEATNDPLNKGLVRAAAPGVAFITATDPTSGMGSSNQVEVAVLGALESIELTPLTATRPVGSFVNYTAIGHFQGGGTQNLTQQLTYTSSDQSVAEAPNTAGNRSRVNALAIGATAIVATDLASGVTSNEVTLTVTGALESIELTPTTKSLGVGEAQNYTAIGHYGGGTTQNLTQKVVYTVVDPNVAEMTTPDNRGRAVALAPGATTIFATDETSGIRSNDVTLTVLGALESLSIAPLAVSRAVGTTQTYTVTGHYQGGGTKNLTQLVTYASRNPLIAEAPNEAGNKSLVRAVGPGETQIFATEETSGIVSPDATFTVP